MQQERWLAFRPEECPESVWDQLLEDGRRKVIDVFAMDYTGLLFDVSSVLASFKVDIHTAKIGTDEDRVADAFYVRKSDGGKIEDPDSLAEIEAALLDTLNRANPEQVRG